MSKRRTGKAAPEGKGALIHHLAVDRFETARDGAGLAVLVTDDGQAIVVPQTLLPEGTQPGSTLALTLSIDHEATADLARSTAAIRADLKQTDPGGTIHL